jgi:hypothetical protein
VYHNLPYKVCMLLKMKICGVYATANVFRATPALRNATAPSQMLIPGSISNLACDVFLVSP